MISLAVSRGGRGVGVGRKVMEFRGSIVRALWHDVSPASWMLTITATGSARCSMRTLDLYFALNTSAACPVGDHQDFFPLAVQFGTSQCCL